MSRIIIGTAHGRNVSFEIPELLVSRLLVQANSGGGKSFLLRRMLEQGFRKVQEIVIDPAGEFATLREKFGFVLVGEHGETPADVRSAGLVAEKLLELRASAVCDLYALKPHERHTWVRLFLTAVMNAPKRLWHPVLFVVDEAHKFCPEKGEGESEAKETMLSLASDGRKYGFCAVFATQRLAKLDKSAASELTNVLIGPTFMDIDLQRAHKALGIVTRDQPAFNAGMKTLSPGHFWALGRAVSKTRVLVKIGGIETTHPTAGSGHYSAEPPPAPEKVKLLLPKLADLPQEAETKARTEAEFRREIRDLKAKLTAAERASTQATPAKPDPDKVRREIERQSAEIQRRAAAAVKQVSASWTAAVRLFQRELERRFAEGMKRLAGELHSVTFNAPAPDLESAPAVSSLPSASPAMPIAPRSPIPMRPTREPRELPADGSGAKMGALQQKIAGILAAYYPEPVRTDFLASLCGKTLGGGWSGRLSEVRSNGLVDDVGKNLLRATKECVDRYAFTWNAPTSTDEAIAIWRHKLTTERHLAMLNRLIEANGEPVPITELAAVAGMTPGGGFSGRLSELRSTRLALDAGKGYMKANVESLFLDSSSGRRLG